MCGINLIFSPSGEEEIRIMTEMTRHRGIRYRLSSYFGGRVYLGFNRLPIQGLSDRWDPPISQENWDCAMVGEVFNFRDIDPGAESDTPVVLDQWIKNGYRIFETFDGFWSCVFIDRSRDRIYVVTDPLAKKPLYYRTDVAAVSSEIFSLAKIRPTRFDYAYFGGVMKWGYCIDGRTPFVDIRKFPRGTVAEYGVDGKLISIRRYSFARNPSNRSTPLKKILAEAVGRRTISDVPISLLLSAGLDSSILYYLLKESGKPFTIFHVDNGEEEYLNDLNIPSHIPVIKISLTSNIEEAIRFNQTPVDLGSVVGQYSLGRAIQSHGFNVAISGDGADELFGGYRRSQNYDSQHSDIFHELVFYHLPRLDFLMMASTVELRCPYLSWPVVDKAMTIPWEMRRSKEYLKKEFEEILPKRILKRKKTPLRNKEYSENPEVWRARVIEIFKNIARKELILYENEN